MTGLSPQSPPIKFRSQGGSYEWLVPLALPPGLWHNGTRYQSKGRWYHASRVRFYEGITAPIGGWRKVLNASGNPIQALDKVRSAMAWRDNATISRLAFGGATKLYTYADQSLSDVTPVGLTTGRTDGVVGGGNYGGGAYGVGNYGTGLGGSTLHPADTWQHDNFGEVLVACLTSDGKLYQCPSPYLSAATVITNAPLSNVGVVVTPERFLVALGAGGDPRLVQWPDQQTTTSWALAVGSQAGSFPLTTKGRLQCGRRMRALTLLWTDVDVHAMLYIGGTLVYAFQQLADNCGLIGPHAVATLGDRAFWMSYDKFFMYDGTVQPLPCDVLDYVFGNLNTIQRSKIVAAPITKFDEVTWYYPSATALENDSYVTYNHREGTWYYGALQRNAAIDRGVFQYPMLLDSAGYLYEHEVGTAMDDGLLPFLESGPLEISDGDQVFNVQRLLADEANLGDVKVTVFGALNPTDRETTYGPFTMGAPTTFRMAARQVRLRFDQVNSVSWRLGVMRLGVIPAGYR